MIMATVQSDWNKYTPIAIKLKLSFCFVYIIKFECASFANRACGPLLSLDCWRYSDRSIDRWNKQKLTRIITKWLDLDRKKSLFFSIFCSTTFWSKNLCEIEQESSDRELAPRAMYTSFKGFMSANLLGRNIFTTVNIYLVEFCVHGGFNQHVQQHTTFDHM